MDKPHFAILTVAQLVARLALFVLALTALTGLWATDGLADDLFQVLDIKVDETDQTAAAARAKALSIGERRAWDELFDRLVEPQQRRPLPEFSAQDIGDAVKDFWVTSEKTSPVRYIATLNYNFRPDRVRRLLSSRGLRFSMTAAPLAVVAPVFETEAGRRLWDEPNPWRAAWQSLRPRGLIPLRIPAGDLGDLSALSAEQAVAGERDRLGDLAKRYDAQDVVVAIATVQVKPDSQIRQLRVLASRYGAVTTPDVPGGTLILPERTFPLEGNEPSADLLKQAPAGVLQELESAWRRGVTSSAAPDSKPISRTMVRVPAASFEEWIDLRRRLEKVTGAGGLKVVALSRDEAQVSLTYPGGTEQLSAALAEAGFALRNEDGKWLLSAAAPQTPGNAWPR